MRLATMTGRKHGLLAGALAITAALAVGTTAFACVYMQGTFTVCGDDSKPTYSQCTTSTGTSPTTKTNFTYTQSGSTSIHTLGTAKVSATGLTVNTDYWVKYFDPAETAAMQASTGWGDWCPADGTALGNPVPVAAHTDPSGAYGPVVVSLPVNTNSSVLGTGYICTTDNEVGAGSTGNTAAVTIVTP